LRNPWAVYRPNLDRIAQSCTPTGAGDVHTSVEFQAEVDGSYYIQVFPHVASVSGIYSVRVLPKHDEAGAGRDPTTLEPNNRRINATALKVGEENAIQSAIEEQTPGYSTNTADTDWFHFRAEAGASYVVELVNVSDKLLIGSIDYGCYGGNLGRYSGMGIGVFDASGQRINQQCAPNGQAPVHTSVEFQALVNDEYYIQVFPHFPKGYGTYTIRVRKK